MGQQGGLFEVLNAFAKPIEQVGIIASGTSNAAFPPSQICFGAVVHLINAAKGVSASLEAITDLLQELRAYTMRLSIYLIEDLSNELKEKLAETLVSNLSRLDTTRQWRNFSRLL